MKNYLSSFLELDAFSTFLKPLISIGNVISPEVYKSIKDNGFFSFNYLYASLTLFSVYSGSMCLDCLSMVFTSLRKTMSLGNFSNKFFTTIFTMLASSPLLISPSISLSSFFYSSSSMNYKFISLLMFPSAPS